jgi:hypothetical protein
VKNTVKSAVPGRLWGMGRMETVFRCAVVQGVKEFRGVIGGNGPVSDHFKHFHSFFVHFSQFLSFCGIVELPK